MMLNTPDKRAEAALLVDRYRMLKYEQKIREDNERLRNDFSHFIRQCFKTVSPGHKYHHNWHIDAIAEHLEACRRGELRRLIINMPPRQMKSICTAISWPAFLIGHNPATQIMCGSYSQALAKKHSLDTQLVIGSEWYQSVFPEVEIDPRQADKGKFVTTQRGHRMAVSTGSTATGEGGDFIIIDDPTNPLQAMSDAERNTANEWFDQTITSRLNDKETGVMVVVMQRLHEEDLSGHLLEKGGWHHLCLQAKAEKKTFITLGNYKRVVEKDELLDPKRLSQKILDETRKDMTAYSYAGQYQQNPAPDEGGILKKGWWRRYPGENPPVCDYIIQFWDTAFLEDQEADYSACTTWGIFMATGYDKKERAACILLDCEYDHWSYPDLKKQALASYKHHRPDKVVIEFKASGQSLFQDMRKLGLPVSRFKVEKDKVYRANVASPVLEKGHVFYMERDWAETVIKECAQFPNGKNDDIVDTCTMAWLYLRKRFWLELPDDGTANDQLTQMRKRKRKAFYGGAPARNREG